MKKIFFVLMGLIVFVLAGLIYSQLELHFPLDPYIDTTFSKDFTWNKYNSIKTGMTKQQVTHTLGKPYRTSIASLDGLSECWEYTQDGRLKSYADFSWYSVKVCFTKGIVTSKPISEFMD